LPESDCHKANVNEQFRPKKLHSGGLVQKGGFLGNSAQFERCC
jgi:hypothetical protein